MPILITAPCPSTAPCLAAPAPATARRPAPTPSRLATPLLLLASIAAASGCATPARPTDQGLALTRAAHLAAATSPATSPTASPATSPTASPATSPDLAAAPTAPNSPAPASTSPTPQTATPLGVWDGEYVVTLHTRWLGPVSARMLIEPVAGRGGGGGGFKANTPPDVAWSILGGLEGNVGPLIAPFLFPRGMILTWNSTLPTDAAPASSDSSSAATPPSATPPSATPGTGTLGPGTLSRLRIATRIARPGAPAELVFRDDRVVGVLTVTPVGVAGWGSTTPDTTPDTTKDATQATTTEPVRVTQAGRDYPAIAAALERAMPDAVYDPSLTAAGVLAPFFEDVRLGATRARDDLEFMFAGAAAARKHVTFQMPLVFPKGPDAASLALLTPEARKETSWKVERDDKQADIAVVRFDSFIDASIVDEAMRDALALNPAALVIDLRSSWGVEVDALRAAQWVITEPVDAGAYVGGPRRTATDEPTRVTIAAPSDFAALKSTLNLQNAADITLLPNPDGQRFDGPVVVLISRRTSSTSEALTAALKRSGRVRVIGEATSGRPLLSREVDLVDGWVLRCAGFDLLAPKGAEAGLTDGRMMRSSWGGSREDPSPTARMVGVRTRGDREWQRSVTPHIAERRDARAAARREIEAIRRAAAR